MLYIANTGDSRAVLVDKDIGQGDMFHTKQVCIIILMIIIIHALLLGS